MVDELEKLALRAEHHEQQAASAAEFEPVKEQGQAEGVVAGVSTAEASANAAETMLRIAEGAAKLFADPRLMLSQEEIDSGRESLAPVIEKYGLAGSGDGRIPFWQELTAGLYLGGLIKRFRRALAQLRADDKAKEQAKQQSEDKARASDGEERKHQHEERPHVVSGAVGVGEVSDLEAPGWLR